EDEEKGKMGDSRHRRLPLALWAFLAVQYLPKQRNKRKKSWHRERRNVTPKPWKIRIRETVKEYLESRPFARGERAETKNCKRTRHRIPVVTCDPRDKPERRERSKKPRNGAGDRHGPRR